MRDDKTLGDNRKLSDAMDKFNAASTAHDEAMLRFDHAKQALAKAVIDSGRMEYVSVNVPKLRRDVNRGVI